MKTIAAGLALLAVVLLLMSGCASHPAPAPVSAPPPLPPRAPLPFLATNPAPVARAWDLPIQYPAGTFRLFSVQGSPDMTNWSTLATFPASMWDSKSQRRIPLPHAGNFTVSNPPGTAVYFWRVKGTL